MSKLRNNLDISLLALLLSLVLAPVAVVAQTVDVWWPTDGAEISGTQPIKALLTGRDVSTYQMFWQVDGGGYVPMPTDREGYPHKEAQIDVSGWGWNDDGEYGIRVIAQDNSGDEIATESVTVEVGGQDEEADEETGSDEENSTDEADDNHDEDGATDETPPVLPPREDNDQNDDDSDDSSNNEDSQQMNTDISVWWPTADARIGGIQPMRAVIDDRSLGTYQMYWRVGEGELTKMQPQSDPDHFAFTADLSGWDWKDSDRYTVTFVAQSLAGDTIAEQPVTFSARADNNADSTQATPEREPAGEEADTGLSDDTETVLHGGNPFAGEALFVDPNQDANQWAERWEDTRPNDADLLAELGEEPLAIWLGDWNQDVRQFVRDEIARIEVAGALPVFVAYNITNRDCGSYSAGGVSSRASYRNWIQAVADGIGDSEAVVLLEPDGLAGADCLGNPTERYRTLKEATEILKTNSAAAVYIDAGNASWHEPDVIAERLEEAGINQADGFALNISNFISTDKNISYGTAVSQELPGNPHFVVDTSRNGNGAAPDGAWCNPAGRAVGQTPTTDPEEELVDAYLWVKGPGGSDGECNGHPPAGQWSPALALELVRNAGW